MQIFQQIKMLPIFGGGGGHKYKILPETSIKPNTVAALT